MTHEGTPAAQTIVQSRGSTAEFVDAYRKTVMEVDHYESHYGESLEENIAMELGSEIATAIRANGELNPLLHWQLQVAIDRSLQRRSQLLEVLEGERNSLQTAIKDCRTLDRRLEGVPDCRISAMMFDDLECHWNRLSDLKDCCEQLIRSRQQFLAERRTSGLDIDNHVSFNNYLYGTLESEFPVLETGLELLDRISRRQ
ncbi:hypothetical protein CP556_22430 [Natrinema sp. CBA1119]|nr:hypothetical protein CP556_22430 [Natrinema sp. CBA1119]